MSEGNTLCSACAANPATVFCCCNRIEFFCSSCESKYTMKHRQHVALPISAFDEHINSTNIHSMFARQAFQTAAESAIRKNIESIDACIALLVTETQRMVDEVWETGNAAFAELSRLKEELLTHVNFAVNEAEEKMYEDEPFCESSWTWEIRRYADEETGLNFFHYQCDAGEVIERVKSMCFFTCETPTYSTLLIPAILDTRLQLYDAIHQTYTQLFLPIKVSNGARHCLIDDTSLLVVGGCPASPDTKLIDVGTGNISQLQMMAVPRWAPGLIKYGDFAYVFGGVGLKSSEKLPLSSKAWQSLPDMQEPRSYFTPCISSDRIYLPASQQAVEVFTPYSESFSVLPIVLSQLTGASVALVRYGKLTVITSDYQVARCRLGEDRVEFDQFPANGDPPSSQCPAIRYGRELFFVFWKTGRVNAFNVSSLGLEQR